MVNISPLDEVLIERASLSSADERDPPGSEILEIKPRVGDIRSSGNDAEQGRVKL
jgi:hypothetical protein